MIGLDIIHSITTFTLEIVLFVLLIIAVSIVVNINLATNSFSDKSLLEKKQQRAEEAGVVESATTTKYVVAILNIHLIRKALNHQLLRRRLILVLRPKTRITGFS